MSFAYLLPLTALSLGAALIFVPTLLFFLHLNRMAHGSGSVSLSSGDLMMTIPSDRFLSVAFDRAG
jgi:hypothetical protein